MLKFCMNIKLFLLIIPSLLFSLDITWDSQSSFKHNKSEYNRAINDYIYPKYNTGLDKKGSPGSIVLLADLVWQDSEDSALLLKDYTRAKEYCDKLDLAGRKDWRLPTKDELLKIVDKYQKPRILSDFKNTSAGDYWSSSVNLTSSDGAWSVQFSDGFANFQKKNKNLHVRCVSGTNSSLFEWYKGEVNKWR